MSKKRKLLGLIIKAFIPTVGALSFATQAAPVIAKIEGEIKEGQILTISGLGFSSKPHHKPLFWWDADLGTEPSSLGIKTSWDSRFNGTIVSEVVAPGSTKAAKFDHSSEAAALGRVDFSSNSIYLYRKVYEDFDAVDAIAIRTRATDLSGNISVGQTVTGSISGATGIIQSINNADSSKFEVYYRQEGGSINDSTRKDFIYGERMVTSTGSFTNSEGSASFPTGTFRTFNYKNMRFWNLAQQNNIYANVQGALGRQYNVNSEHTDSTLWNASMLLKIEQTPRKWKFEEVYYKSSDIDVRNGIWDFRINGQKAWDRKFINRTSAKPNPYSTVYQSQVSNGAQPESFVFYDSLYIDDTWHHVALCSKETWSQCTDKEIQIPEYWSDSKVIVHINTGSLNLDTPLYLYVVDGNGQANESGFALCGRCPTAPVLRVSDLQ